MENTLSAPYSALTIANYVIYFAKERQLEINNLKLQKILYFIQSRFLVEEGHSIFEDCIEKWKLGPVIPEVYHEFKGYGRSQIDEPTSYIEYKELDGVGSFEIKEFKQDEIDLKIREILDNTIEKLLEFDTFDLVKRTHEHTSWKSSEEDINNGIQHIQYDVNEIKLDFMTHPEWRIWSNVC
jgi:uncharacterized phage-associated protein